MPVLNVQIILVLLALLMVIASAIGRCPLWIPVFLLVLIELIRTLPAR